MRVNRGQSLTAKTEGDKNSLLLNRMWAMPNAATFRIPPIARLLARYTKVGEGWADPFAGNAKVAQFTNDLDPNTTALQHQDALSFLRNFSTDSLCGGLWDPPYSPRQVSEVYRKVGGIVNKETTQSSFWAKLKDEWARVIQPDGYVITFGWNTNGVGQSRGFDLIEILIVAHGGWHNDTLVTVERKHRKLKDQEPSDD